MKVTPFDGIRYWSVFQPDRHIDFNGFYWPRPAFDVLIDPMPLSAAQLAGIDRAVTWIILTNADHRRAAPELARHFGARIVAPIGDRELLAGVDVAAWYGPDAALPGELAEEIDVRWIRGGKSEAEAVLWLRSARALLFGDAVRSHVSGRLRLLPPEKMRDPDRVRADVLALAGLDPDAILLGDGDCIFAGTREVFGRLIDSCRGPA